MKTDREIYEEYLEYCYSKNMRPSTFKELLSYGIFESKRRIERLTKDEKWKQ